MSKTLINTVNALTSSVLYMSGVTPVGVDGIQTLYFS